MADKPAVQINPDNTPKEWVSAALKVTSSSVVIPPYIRFLKGSLLLRQAVILLKVSHVASQEDVEANIVLDEIKAFDSSKEAKELNVNYETYFASHLTINLVSEVEHFFASAVSAALRLYPQKMGQQSYKLGEIIEASSREELIDRAANASIYQLMYEKPLDYLAKLTDILSIESDKLMGHWPAFVELKARRDLGIHNNWIVNEIYLRKLREAKIECNHKMGEQLIPDFKYLMNSVNTTSELIKTMASLLGEKWMPENNPFDKIKIF